MNRQALVIGLGTALIAAYGSWHWRWFLEQTPKGRALVEVLGWQKARIALQFLLLVVFVFGIGLACGWLPQVRW